MTRSSGSRSASIFWGIALMVIGTMLLLNNVDVVRLRDVLRWVALSLRNLWPLVFVVLGMAMIAEGLRQRRGRRGAEPGAGS